MTMGQEFDCLESEQISNPITVEIPSDYLIGFWTAPERMQRVQTRIRLDVPF